MSLLRKSKPAPAPTPEPDAEVAGGKGRPTPKRRDVAPKRQPISAPQTAKEASRLRKQQNAQARSGTGRGPAAASKMSTREYREAMRRGDESVLPRRDKGPVRKLARDYVDTHLLFSNFLLPSLLLVLFAGYIPHHLGQYVTIALFVLFAMEWLWVGRRIHNLARQRFDKVADKPWVLGLYAGQRAFMPRRWRSPKATLRRGDDL